MVDAGWQYKVTPFRTKDINSDVPFRIVLYSPRPPIATRVGHPSAAPAVRGDEIMECLKAVKSEQFHFLGPGVVLEVKRLNSSSFFIVSNASVAEVKTNFKMRGEGFRSLAFCKGSVVTAMARGEGSAGVGSSYRYVASVPAGRSALRYLAALSRHSRVFRTRM